MEATSLYGMHEAHVIRPPPRLYGGGGGDGGGALLTMLTGGHPGTTLGSWPPPPFDCYRGEQKRGAAVAPRGFVPAGAFSVDCLLNGGGGRRHAGVVPDDAHLQLRPSIDNLSLLHVTGKLHARTCADIDGQSPPRASISSLSAAAAILHSDAVTSICCGFVSRLGVQNLSTIKRTNGA